MESMKMTGSMGNNGVVKVTMVDGKPLKSILKKPKDWSHVTSMNRSGTMHGAASIWNIRTDVASGCKSKDVATKNIAAGSDLKRKVVMAIPNEEGNGCNTPKMDLSGIWVRGWYFIDQ
ncbi:hypothetical protein Tco_1077015 [Tanacetum coccineum]